MVFTTTRAPRYSHYQTPPTLIPWLKTSMERPSTSHEKGDVLSKTRSWRVPMEPEQLNQPWPAFAVTFPLAPTFSITAAGKIVTFPLHYEQGCNIFSYDLRT
jgi:hypothetical protein